MRSGPGPLRSTDRRGDPRAAAPFFFGGEGRRLFGVYHAPERQPARAGVLICQSFGHEYVRAHRAIRNLAASLAREGFPVLRFDYRGCGDSEGDSAELSLRQSVTDAAAAAAELKQRSGARKVAAIGQRFGAAVALLAFEGRSDLAATILWDPVLRGATYLHDLQSLHVRWMQAGGRQADGELTQHPDALLGFTCSAGLRAELAALDLLPAIQPRPRAAVLHVVASEPRPDAHLLSESLAPVYGASAWRLLNEPVGWNDPDSIHTALSAPQALQSIAAALLSATSAAPSR